MYQFKINYSPTENRPAMSPPSMASVWLSIRYAAR